LRLRPTIASIGGTVGLVPADAHGISRCSVDGGAATADPCGAPGQNG
jgi:hypothetical protein